MDTSQQTIRTYFGKLGLEHEVADIYLALHAHGPQGISALSRSAKVERTRIYRLIDRLMESNLIELESSGRRGIIKAAPIANLRILINKREEELRNLHDELGLIEQTLARNSLSNPAVHIQTFQGPEGIRQLLGLCLESQTEVLRFSDDSLEAYVGSVFMAGWRADFASRKLHGRMMAQNSAASPESPLMTRTLAPDSYRILYPGDIYDDTVTSYHWREGEVYATAIRNKEMADSQRQLFDLLWDRAKEEIPSNRSCPQCGTRLREHRLEGPRYCAMGLEAVAIVSQPSSLCTRASTASGR